MLTDPNLLNITWTDIVWAAITAGKPGASHLLAHRWHSLADLVVRSHTIYANLRQKGGSIERSSLYDSLDPSEKSAVSYFLGMVMAKLFAMKLLNTPWLFHVSQATAGGAKISFKHGSKSQPDLIGRSRSGDWLVIEAKGRTNRLDEVALITAKRQTRMIRAINGAPPYLKVALQAYFDHCLNVVMDDPDDRELEAVDLKLDLAEVTFRYYAVAATMTTNNSKHEKILGQEYVVRSDEDSGISIGIQRRVQDNVANGRLDEVLNIQDQTAGVVVIDENTAVYPDGLLVRLDSRWSTFLMAREPERRAG